jgi:anti-sigma regulatory factor (Ser/Thr protein kinase)
MSKPAQQDGPQQAQQSEREVSFTFPASNEAVPLARAELSKTLCDWGLEQLADDLLLCLSEAVTNALFYVGPGSNITVHVTATDHTVHIEVDDDGDAEPQLQTPVTASGQGAPALDAVPAGGYGLMLIQALSDSWGVRRLAVGKAVWFERDASGAVAV